MSIFLTAKWKYLILITYSIPPEKLNPFLPAGTELDTIEGNAFASLVAFDFRNTRVKRFKIPFHVNFPEINLRFYVKEKKNGRRGVVFIKEFVPKFLIASVASLIYNEPYESIKMKRTLNSNGNIHVKHELIYKNDNYFINIDAENKPYKPSENSKEHFFKEHSLGFGKNKRGDTLAYEVSHPVWNVFPITKAEHNIDFEKIYGKHWQFLNGQKPYNVTFAKGSEIKVFSAEKLKA